MDSPNWTLGTGQTALPRVTGCDFPRAPPHPEPNDAVQRANGFQRERCLLYAAATGACDGL